MAARHRKGKHKAHGGAAENPPVGDVYAGENSQVVKSAREKKRGGGVKHHVEGKKMEGHRFDHVRRATGGRVGADKAPFTTAARYSEPTGTKETMHPGVGAVNRVEHHHLRKGGRVRER